MNSPAGLVSTLDKQFPHFFEVCWRLPFSPQVWSMKIGQDLGDERFVYFELRLEGDELSIDKFQIRKHGCTEDSSCGIQ